MFKDSKRKEELCTYMDACIEYDIPMNSVTYFIYKMSTGIILRDMVMSLHRTLVRGNIWN